MLIVDVMGAEILNACMKMTELGQRRIALVEKLELARKPLANMEAIYVIKPDEESVRADSIRSQNLRRAHVYALEDDEDDDDDD